MIQQIRIALRCRLWFLVVLAAITACGPKIDRFDVTPRTMCAGDTIRATWDISGTPTMLIQIAQPDSDTTSNNGDKPGSVWLTLVVEKGGKEAVQHVQIETLPQMTEDVITFTTTLRGDTLVAAGTKSLQRWGNRFEIRTVASGSNRSLIVRHADRVVELNGDGMASQGLEGTALEGKWELLSLLTDADRRDMTNAPDRLRIRATIQCKKR